jgi:hypothetical protein
MHDPPEPQSAEVLHARRQLPSAEQMRPLWQSLLYMQPLASMRGGPELLEVLHAATNDPVSSANDASARMAAARRRDLPIMTVTPFSTICAQGAGSSSSHKAANLEGEMFSPARSKSGVNAL